MCRPPLTKENVLKEDEKWIPKFDLAAFTADIHALGKKLEKEQGEDDVRHLRKMVSWSNMCAFVGFITMGLCVNPISVVALSLFTFSRWTMIAHHTCHGGYDKCHPDKNRWTRFKFAIGSLWRRLADWFDWMMPEAWNVEHNNRHHYNLSEKDDPDNVEENNQFLRSLNVPIFVKYMIVGFFMTTWKWFYYSPNTYKELKLARLRRLGKPIPKGVDPATAITMKEVVMGNNSFYSAFEFFSVVVGPYFLIHFFIAPLPYFAIGNYFGMGNTLYQNAIINLFLAEILTNIHGFIAVVTNHAGNDMYRFRDGCRPFSGSFYLRQVLASVDFAMGTDVVDFMHGWLNYQIEHHLWPNLSMLSYQRSAPLVREICKKHGVPYIKENVFIRLKKTVDIMVGASDMKWFPENYEKDFLALDAKMESAKNK
eukprot:CAMPEP_0178912554 /NCGR_PEP_ID=MMETSP0786-20121207/10334_1 /TAXON_ID=186022 /ORGANISM="Thalassionema frauenfeldii, Strain CCMP 1798" /LENGTH=423 /DNA_ID=CAMNT_0020585163 /DNA_START=193 /DNA_END=1464 /DNA_ORIENTATION=-